MRILIFGAGAVGCYIGGHLATAGHTITLLGRERVTRLLQEHGLTIRRADPKSNDIVLKNVHTATSIAEARGDGPGFDLIIFTMKAYDTAPAIQDLRPHLDTGVPILCLQNGIGNEETLKTEIGPDRVIAGTLTTAVSMGSDGVVQEETQRGVALAADSPAYPAALDAFQGTKLNIKTVADTATLKWSKLLLNMIGNATSAILDLPPAQIMRDRELFSIEAIALRETLAIMKLQGIQVVNLPGASAAALAFVVRHLPTTILQPLLFTRFVSARGTKLPSLAVALRNGDRRTEVAWLNGAVAHAARSISRLAPINHALALLVSDIASGRIPWEMYRYKPAVLLAAVRAARGNSSWRYGE